MTKSIASKKQSFKASAEDYKSLFEHVGCGVYISTKEGKFLTADQVLLDMLCYKNKSEFLAMDITHDLYLRSEDRRKFQQMIEREGRVIDYEVEFKRQDGSPITVLLTSHVRYDSRGDILGYEGIVLDQSQRIQMEEKLRVFQEDFKRLFENIPVGVSSAPRKANF